MENKKPECPICEGIGWLEYIDEDGYDEAFECKTCDGTGEITLKVISEDN